MRNDLSAVLIGICLLGVAWTIVLALRDRSITDRLLIVLAVAEVLVVAQLVVAIALVISGDRPDSTATFLAYAVGALVVLPIAVVWSVAEKSRSSTLVITVACLAVPVMTARMLQIWSTVNG